jgi:hypothetical protein
MAVKVAVGRADDGVLFGLGERVELEQNDLGVYTGPLGCRGGISRGTSERVCADA